jgi:uncharacterized protein
VSVEEVAAAVQKIEHDADRLVHEVEETLARTFITPIDREDIQALASELDDLVDLTNMAARACVLLGIPKPTEPMKELAELLVEASAILAEILPALRQHRYADLVAAKRRIRVVEKRGDQVYRDALSRLFKSPDVDVKSLLREREVLEDLERALDTAEGVADSLAFLAVKHG